MIRDGDEQRRAAEDAQVVRALAALAGLVVLAVGPLGVTLVWLFSLECAEPWHLVAGPLPLAGLMGLMVAVLRRLGEDPPSAGGRGEG